MANYLEKMIGDDFVWTTITGALTGRRKRANTGFVNIDCPMCIHRGHNPDKRQRCGVKNNNPGVFIYCFNCHFSAGWLPGESLSPYIRDFMAGVGVPDIEIKRLNHRALVYRRLVEANPEAQAHIPATFSLEFPAKPLPKGALSFNRLAEQGCDDPDFHAVAEYLFNRGDDVAAASTYYWSPETDNSMRRRVIIPFLRHGEIVGWTARLIDSPQQIGGKLEPKYYNNNPLDFVFNNHVMEDKARKYVVVVEGVFDALAIDGVATCGAKLSDKQAAWIDGMGKTVIVLPDHDKSGERLIDKAISRGWYVSLPLVKSGSAFNWWEPDIKDAADAVKRYGRFYTLTSIIKSATNNPTAINVKRKMMRPVAA
jgi:hypothetical protein